MSPSTPPPSPGEPAAAARLAGRLAIGRDGHDQGAAIAKVATGIRGFDHVAMGGLPRRRTTVVAGPAGAAKTLFAAQFLAEGVRQGQPGVFVTLEEPAVDLRANFSTLGWDVAGWEAAGDWRFVDGSPLASEPGERPRYDIDTLAAQIGAAVDRTGAQRLVLDSLSGVLSLQDDAVVARQLLRGLVLRMRGMGLTVVLTVETDDGAGGSLSRYGVEEFVADNVVLLRNVREGTFRRRTVEVLKMRGAMHHKGDVPFTVVPGEGLRVLAVTAPSPPPTPTPRERVSTGVAGLDRVTHGGFFRASNAVVSGATGTGKTMIVTQFAAEGCARGERVLVIAYEETCEQVFGNGGALGHDFEQYERDGLLHVVSLYPEVASLDDHLVELTELLERVRPARLVLDGLSALERLGSEQSYGNLLIGVTAFARSSGLSTFITASPPAVSGSLTTPNHVTGLADVIVVLRHHESGSRVHRGLLVQRMRGSGCESTVSELTIGPDGVVVGDPLAVEPEQPLMP